MAVFAVLTVCTGNICRSPLAELILRDGLADVPEVEIMSAGTGARDSDLMPPQSVAIARSLGLDPEPHRSQRLVDGMLDVSDLVIAMSRDHRRTIVTSVPRALQRSFTAREFARLSAGLTAEEIAEACTQSTSVERLGAAVRLVASRRGSVAAQDASDDDVLDPFGRADDAYRQSADELIPALTEIARVLRTAALGATAPRRPQSVRPSSSVTGGPI